MVRRDDGALDQMFPGVVPYLEEALQQSGRRKSVGSAHGKQQVYVKRGRAGQLRGFYDTRMTVTPPPPTHTREQKIDWQFHTVQY